MFVKWINSVYLMNKNWWEYEITAECSWYWRKIVAVKNAFKEKMDLTSFVNTKYSIKQGYKMLFEQQQVMKVEWCSIVWERLSILKHRVIMWLVLLGRIRTRDKLWNLGIVSDQLCMLCGNATENIQHLFFECWYSSGCLQEVQLWLGWKSTSRTLEGLLKWIRKARMSVVKKRILYAVLSAVIYHIWRVRNDALWASKIWMIKNIVQRIEQEVKMRVRLVMPKKATKNDREWVDSICTK